jgi:DNA-binding CsgD family transcriptional regulator/tetratricopeptide (TPR) repeat protein
LLERSGQLSSLAELFAAMAQSGHGRMVLVSGEAGIGKTSLVRRFCDQVSASGRVFWGACDQSFTPRPLGPFVDVARLVEGDLAKVIDSGAVPYEIATAVGSAVERHPPSILVIEDVHAADEATLDVLRALAQRVDRLPVVVIATYRDVGLDRWHPLRLVLGEIAAGSTLARFRLVPLSREAVARMAGPRGVAVDDLYLKTAGNPFFVTEALAAPDEAIPPTVRDAVLARAARLSRGARMLLDAIAVAGTQAELWLLEILASDCSDCLEECLGSGIVVARTRAVGFSHELARLAIEESIPMQRRLALHRAALVALESPPYGTQEPARLANHARATGDPESVLRFAPKAAAHASKLGAHREAAIHYGEALRFAELLPLEERAALFSARAFDLFVTVQFREAITAQEQALRCYEELGVRPAQGAALAFLAQIHWQVGSLAKGLATAQRALDVLQGLPGPELAAAYRMMSILLLAAEDPVTAMTWAKRTEELAEQLDHPHSRVAALQMIGWVEFYTGGLEGLDKLVRALELARAAGFEDLVAVTYAIIVRTAGRLREYEISAPYVRAGVEYCSKRDFDVWRYYLLSWESNQLLAEGRWDEAAQTALICLGDENPFARIHALITLGLVRARRGDPEVWEPLDEALALAEPRHELQWIAPVAIARAEAAWLEGRIDDVVAETELAYEDSKRLDCWYLAGLSYWRWRAGLDEPIPTVGEEQYRLEMAGDWAAASERWAVGGCVYSTSFALMDADDEAVLQRALAGLQALGAKPAAAIFARKLRERGAVRVPRGQRPATRANLANLTARELEVLTLLAGGLRNSEIAARLFVAEKTVDHHVSAILGKLGVKNRVQAVSQATQLGIIGQGAAP